MTGELTVISISEIGALTDAVHDCSFSASSVIHDTGSDTVTIEVGMPDLEGRVLLWHLGPVARYRVPVIKALLQIHHVEAIRLEDPEGIDILDIDEVKYDAGRSRVAITGMIPRTFMVAVRELKLTLRTTESVLRWVKRLGVYRK